MTTEDEYVPRSGVVMRDMWLSLPLGTGPLKIKKGTIVTIIGQFFVHRDVPSIEKDYLMVQIEQDTIPIPMTLHDILIPSTM
jgi:hypothetical protein